MPNSVSNETQRQPKPVRKLFYVFYLLITFGIAAGTIISILRAERWLFATIAALIPYGVFFLLAFFLHPIFRRLCNRTGGIILLAYLICGILVFCGCPWHRHFDSPPRRHFCPGRLYRSRAL